MQNKPDTMQVLSEVNSIVARDHTWTNLLFIRMAVLCTCYGGYPIPFSIGLYICSINLYCKAITLWSMLLLL
jgi:hypothetical protein